MKKVTIRLLLSLVLVTTVVVAGATPVSAAKPIKLGITITDISDGSITVDYWWNKIGAHYYRITVYEVGGGGLNTTGTLPLGGRMPSCSGNMTFTNASITCDHEYGANIVLYRRAEREIRGATAFHHKVFNCPLPFCEDFTGQSGYLSEGWSTNNSSVVFVSTTNSANGTMPELCLLWGFDEDTTYDYWACTPAIDATAATTTLNLTFKHALWIYDFARNFTYSVEVSNDAGSTWTALLEETPTEAQYPEEIIGPETVNIDLGAYVGDEILIRWRLREYTWHSDGWYIDDVCVNGA